MKMSHWLVSAIGAVALGAVALGALAMPAQAAPIGALTGTAASAQQEGASAAEQVNYRCFWRYGRRHCRHYYGYAPGITFYYGGRRHHRHHRHW